MPDIHFDRYYRYDDLTRLLHAYAEEFPQLVQVQSLGKSYEGRDIWLATLTNRATGAAEEKPALWVDGNIHASEVSPSSACLYLIQALTSGYGKHADFTRALDTRTFYVCPRLNPDGAELALADKPRIIRSSTRPYPYDEEGLEGLIEQDIDGDGRMLQMRIPDPNGAWKPHPDEPRLMIRRDPTEVGGTYYRILPEGLIKNYDGVTISLMRNKEGLDLNRNYPAHWRQEGEQVGAGEYPTSEPEVRAAVAFIVAHPNITGAVAFHTWSGVLLRPSGVAPDDSLPAEDLWTFQHIGKKGTELTGYPAISNFHDFKYHPKEVITGTFDDWAYDHLGLYAWTVELWSPQRQAGITEYKFIDWYREHPVEDALKMLKWSDEKLDGKGYVDWYAFEHPQLGTIELGGWNMQYAWRNPPPQYLEREIAPFADWLTWHALISPRLELHSTQVTPLGEGNYLVRLVVQNSGWLPTYVSKKALERKVVRGVICEVRLPEGAKLLSGKERHDFGQLEGRAYIGSSATPWAVWRAGGTSDRLKAEWVIHAPQGGTLELIARQERSGVVRVSLTLGG
ncbi:MAG: carboxypeptidase [Candidatus Thermofonsia Clade 1 bacterium]|jgi:murein tripeptide amidase MpaA|uniref:Carboxypeptidase n=1 Tax=Candidatus Thermofonsia Clade 1 bacterium TaxID=2364210 RepID=A0A2M8PEP1_9CHLR|nr:MAG: carboxypeptidase [Candidatus Thermofonsia Clade 1 bacterium]RMF48893.1 MAG: carboxypeptidase [Chloroflexota bacterium]